jgi:hypothetical protein
MSPLDLNRTAVAMFNEYFKHCSDESFDRISFYRARTYLKHLIHTVRMKGTEDPGSVTLWLDKAEECLKQTRLSTLSGVSKSQRREIRAVS